MSAMFTARLIALRKELGISQEELGNRINKKRTTVAGYENAGKEPDIDTICLLCDIFNVSPDYLLGYTSKRQHPDSVLFGDSSGFSTVIHSISAQELDDYKNCFSSFYKLLQANKTNNSLQLALYSDILTAITNYKIIIQNLLHNAGHSISDPAILSGIMSCQAELKSSVAILLDKLFQSDFAAALKLQENISKDNEITNKSAI